jgi:hypothetical protein
MDACYMAMGEVAYQIRGSVDVLVGAEGLEPEFGWPYRQILAAAKAHYQKTGRSMQPEELATLIVNVYVDHYSEYDRAAGRSADLAAIRLSERNGTSGVAGVADALQTLAAKLHDLPQSEHKKILLAHWYAQTYKFDQFVDLKDFCDQLQQQFPPESEIWACSADLMTAITDCIIRSGCSGFACQYSYGFSIYFPWSYVSPDYSEIEMATYTHWNCFLQKHIIATRRPSRYLHDPLFPVVAEDVDPGQVATQRQDAMNKVLDRNAPTDPAVKRIFDRVARLRQCPPLPGENDEDNSDRVDAVAKGIVASDVPSSDVGREFTRRFLRRSGVGPAGHRYTENTLSSRYSEHSRYAERSRYSEHSRYVEDRETWVKNLPPEVGTAYFPKSV